MYLIHSSRKPYCPAQFDAAVWPTEQKRRTKPLEDMSCSRILLSIPSKYHVHRKNAVIHLRMYIILLYEQNNRLVLHLGKTCLPLLVKGIISKSYL